MSLHRITKLSKGCRFLQIPPLNNSPKKRLKKRHVFDKTVKNCIINQQKRISNMEEKTTNMEEKISRIEYRVDTTPTSFTFFIFWWFLFCLICTKAEKGRYGY